MRLLPAGALAVTAAVLAIVVIVPRQAGDPGDGAPPRESTGAAAVEGSATPTAADEAPGTPANVSTEQRDPGDSGPAPAGSETATASPTPAVSSALVVSAHRLASAGQAIAGALTEERAAYIGALRARDAGDLAFAESGFNIVVQRGGVLAPVARLRLAQVQAARSRYQAAADTFDAALADPDLPGALGTVASMEAAAAREELGQFDRAVELLTFVLDSPSASATDRATARWEIARIRRDVGNPAWTADAVATLSLAPSSSAARRALDALEEAGASYPLLPAAYVRYRAFANVAAQDLYLAALDAGLTAEEAAVAWFYLGALAERFGDREGALDAYARSLESDAAGYLADDARYWRGRVLEELGEVAAAAQEYDLLVAAYPQSPFLEDAELRAAVGLGLSGLPVESLDRLEAIASARGGRAGANAARWHEVLRGLHGIERAPLDPAQYDPTALAALIHADSMAPLPAAAFLEDVNLPPGGDLVDGWMAEVFGPPPASPPEGDVLSHPLFVLGTELAAVGEDAVGRALVRSLVSRYSDQPYELVELSRAAAEAGFHDVAMLAGMRLLSPLSTGQLLSAPKSVVALAYPAPYRHELSDALAESRLPPLLVLALVRQESAFNPRAGSHAGALGLTQVIEPTGRAIAQALGVPWNVDDLYDPATSLRFGGYYLYVQLEQFDGNVFAALAAYNGGPGNAARWLDAQTIPGPDGYVRAVDFAETRLYLEKVLENYAWYRYLYAGAPAPALP